MNYHDIIRIEPYVETILSVLRPSARKKTRYRRYEAVKAALHGYVGHGARNPDLQTEEAYETVLREVSLRLRL